ncbi:wsae [Stenotrophomonas sp. ZAC14D2_NAIMI4_6]|uniref:wsae n=1 Tax=Stenotrophomonas sp. ZAC14D2_NAIMI4_6 TaxID=2072406 RepID=UPI001F4070CD|nr:wsae [Stenotrophomonas sp. ZAC14D2_NAIMI4_6]
MARVAGRAVIVGFPPEQEWVKAAELDANNRWFELFGEDYVWLQEHKEFGLVDTAGIVATFEAAGFTVLRFGQGNAELWASLMGAHFIKVKYPELEPLVAAADRLYNSRVFAGDHSEQPYREYCVAVRLESDAERLRADPPFQAGQDEEATALLKGLARGLRDLAVRTRNSEGEWEATARALDAYIVDLDSAKREWGDTARYALELQAAKDAGDAHWLAQQQQWEHRDRQGQQELAMAKERNEQLVADAIASEQRAEQIRLRSAEDLEQHAAAYARSRRRWKIAMLVIGVVGVAAGLLLGWAVF